MTRRLKSDRAEEERERAANELAVMVKRSAPRPKYDRSFGKQRVAKLIHLADERRKRGEWADAKVAELVALYVLLHKFVYDVEPAEMKSRDWAGASSACRAMLRDEFAGVPVAMVDYIVWCWRREREKEQWRRQNNREGPRLTWRHQFQQRSLLTDYRVHKAREKAAR